MSTDYDRILAENLETYGKGTGHLAIFGQLYSDRTHFIFELLQNAEDAGASQILFRLSPERLDVLHDGRVFDENDVRGVCGIAAGTKAHDLTKIGKFGIGFKAVYAYVDSVDVHSGAEHFRIESYIRPHPIDAVELDHGFTTLFHLPFRAGEAPAAAASVGAALNAMDPMALLFLHSLSAIEIKVQDSPTICLERVNLTEPNEFASEVQLRVAGRDGDLQDWLVFSRAVDALAGASCSRVLRVALAFRIVERDERGRPHVQELADSPLVVFFPTTLKTNLGFVVQGPFRTTPTRETVPVDEPFNKQLVGETAALAVEALRWFRAQGILDVAVLRAMPVNRERFPAGSMFRPIFDRVLDAMRTEELVPVKPRDAGSPEYVDAKHARTTGWAEIEELLEGNSLARLEGTMEELRWVSRAVATDRILADYLEKDVLIRQVTPVRFIEGLSVEFLSAQLHEWMGKLYGYFGSVKEWRHQLRYNPTSLPFVSKQVVRLASGAHVSPLRRDGRPAAFLPIDGHTTVTVVEPATVVTEDALAFFKALRYEPADEYAAVCEHVLPKYREKRPFDASDEYLMDLQQVLRVYRAHSQDRQEKLRLRLDQSAFVWALNASTGKDELVRPGDAYFETPELRTYFEGNPGVWFVHSALKDYFKQLAELGVATQVRVFLRSADEDGDVAVSRRHGAHERGIDGFDPGFHIAGLDHAVAKPTAQRSEYIWNELLRGRARQIRGVVESSNRRTFERPTKAEQWSIAAGQLRKAAWLPTADGRWGKPEAVSLAELPDRFVRDNELARQLGLRIPIEETSAELAARLGIAPEVLDMVRQGQVSGAELKEFLALKRARAGGDEKKKVDGDLPLGEREGGRSSSAGNGNEVASDEEAQRRRDRRGSSGSGTRSGESTRLEGADGLESNARPHPEEGIRAQEWLRAKLAALFGESVLVSAGEESPRGESGRSDIILRSNVSAAELYIEVKRIEGRRVYWSQEQIGIARRHPGSYVIALLTPVDECPSDYAVNWVWDPLHDFLNAERKVQWTWQVQATGSFGDDWRPVDCAPAREADGFKALIQVSTEMLGNLPSGLDAIRGVAVRVGLLPNVTASAAI